MKKPTNYQPTEYEAYLLHKIELFNDKLDKLLNDDDMKNLNKNIKVINDLTNDDLGLDEGDDK